MNGWRGRGTQRLAVRATPMPELRSEWVSFEGPKVSIYGEGVWGVVDSAGGWCVCVRGGGAERR